MRNYLDKLASEFETEEFIKDDPVYFAHYFKGLKNSTNEDVEFASFLASLFAFGRRDAFIKKLKLLFEIMQDEPINFIKDFNNNQNAFDGFVYRFIKDEDLKEFFNILHTLYVKDKSSIGELFYNNRKQDMLQSVCDYFYIQTRANKGSGFYFLLANPKNKGAMKRINMYLRWMVRDNSPVDLGIWDFIDKSNLLIPLDAHVANISRQLGLLRRTADDFKAVVELTDVLKEFCPNDPIKYDFALFGAGVNGKELTAPAFSNKK